MRFTPGLKGGILLLFKDSSVIIDYLDAAVEYVDAYHDKRAVAPPLVLFEVFQGEVFKSGPADFEAVGDAL